MFQLFQYPHPAQDTRVSWKDHAYNWFLESPPGDLFMQRVKECAWQFLNGVSCSDRPDRP